jgi:hypothetical protein
MSLIKENNNKININIFNTFLIYIGSNLSLYLASCFIKKYKINKYKIVFTGQGGDRKSAYEDLEYILSKLDLNIKNFLVVEHDFNYNYFKMFKNSNSLRENFLNFQDKENVTFVTSYNYGLVNSLLKNIYDKKLDYYILEDGIENWIDVKNKYYILKSFLYSIVIKKLIVIKKNRSTNTDIIISSLKNRRYYQTKNLIDISDEFKNMVNLFSNSFKLKCKKENNILIICARTSWYVNGIDKFLINIRDNLFDQNKNLNNNNTDFYFKLHPGYTLENNKINFNIFKLIDNNSVPVEFFNLNKINYILSPINTSIVYIKELFNTDKKNIYYYNIKQKNYKKKLKLIKEFNIRKFKNKNYLY